MSDYYHQAEEVTIPTLNTLHLKQALAVKLDKVDYVLPSLPRGKVGLLSAAGGVGKSFWMLQASLQIAACGYCDFDLAGVEFEKGDSRIGSVLIVSLEDESEDLSRRYQSIQRHWLNDAEKAEWITDIADNQLVELLPMAGQGITLINNNGEAKPWLDAIASKAQSMHHCRLIVVDTLRRSHDCDENDNGVMSKVLRQFEILAKNTGCSVLLLHHESKAAIQNSGAGAGAMRGASAIVDNARWVMRMQRMTVNEAEQRGIVDNDIRKRWIRVTNEKANYGKEENEKWLYRGDTGVLVRKSPPAVQQQAARIGGRKRVG
ncbi:helicase RepA family protein [Pseudomonadota bacterium]|nr:helicase RepA family protein [Pseudomonadota bacterium]